MPSSKPRRTLRQRLLESEGVRHKGATLHEIAFGKPVSIDKEAGVIRGCKLLGRNSLNDRVYSESAMNDAKRLYDNLEVNIDHPKAQNAAKERGIMESPGVIRNTRVEEDGVYGDFHYLKSHPASDVILERAERFPDKFGFSHNAVGDTNYKGGKTVVESLVKAHSLDLVTRPATTRGLFESEDSEMVTLGELLESSDCKGDVAEVLSEFNHDMPLSKLDGEIDDQLRNALCEAVTSEFDGRSLSETINSLWEKLSMAKGIRKNLKQLMEEINGKAGDGGGDDPDLSEEEIDKFLDQLSDEQLDAVANGDFSSVNALLNAEGGEDTSAKDKDGEGKGEETGALATVESVVSDLDQRMEMLERRELLQDLLEERGLALSREERNIILECKDPKDMVKMVDNIPLTGSHYVKRRPTTILTESHAYEGEYPKNGEEFAGIVLGGN